MFLGLINLKESFDTLNWNLLITTLKTTGLD